MTSKLTREERVQALYDLKVGQVLSQADIENVKMLSRMALAAMDSEPVAWTWQNLKQWHVTNDEERARDLAWDGVKVEPLYRHAQPVPVVSADLLHTAASAIEDLLEHTDPNTNYYSGVWADMPSKLRGAMLQASNCRENANSSTNSPVIGIDPASGPECSVEVRYVAPPGYVMVPKEPTEEMLAAAKEWTGLTSTAEVVYIKMLAAAPQEVKGE